MENEIVSGAASTDLAASYDDSEFSAGLAEAFGLEEEEPAGAAESGEDGEGSEDIPEGQTETEGTETEPTEGAAKEAEAAESGAEGAEAPKMLFFKEHGKEFGVPEEAVEAFAKGVGRDSASIIDIYQKGCNYDALMRRFDEANEYSEAFGRLAEIRNISKQQAKTEIIALIEKTAIDKAAGDILDENPGMKRETAEELAKFRIEQQKPKTEAAPKQQEDSEEDAARLREVDMFIARHSGEGIEKLPNEVIEIWKKTGISLEEAYEGFKNKERIAALEKELSEIKREKKKTEQKDYAKEHSAGSANSAAGNVTKDPFVEGLFAEY